MVALLDGEDVEEAIHKVDLLPSADGVGVLYVLPTPVGIHGYSR
jgi:hypothetical protein